MTKQRRAGLTQPRPFKTKDVEDIKKLNQSLKRLETRQYRSMKHSPSSLRKARTRTLIQLGGLIEKSGILPYLDITIGDDLQLQEDLKESVDILLGALVDVKQSLEYDTAYKKLALEKGIAAWNQECYIPITFQKILECPHTFSD